MARERARRWPRRQDHDRQDVVCRLPQGGVRQRHDRGDLAAVLSFLRKFEQDEKLEPRDRVRSAGEQICLYADVEESGYNPFRPFGKQLLKNESTPRPALTRSADVADLFKKIAAPFPPPRYVAVLGHPLRFIPPTPLPPCA